MLVIWLPRFYGSFTMPFLDLFNICCILTGIFAYASRTATHEALEITEYALVLKLVRTSVLLPILLSREGSCRSLLSSETFAGEDGGEIKLEYPRGLCVTSKSRGLINVAHTIGSLIFAQISQ